VQVRAEVVEDVYTSRKKQHQTMMHYFCSLNTLQYKKKTALLEPLLGYMQAQVLKHTHTLGLNGLNSLIVMKKDLNKSETMRTRFHMPFQRSCIWNLLARPHESWQSFEEHVVIFSSSLTKLPETEGIKLVHWKHRFFYFNVVFSRFKRGLNFRSSFWNDLKL